MNKDNYEDIIELPHHVSSRYPQMSKEARAAQFAPFAALTGYSEAIKESSRLTDKRIEIGDGLKQILNEKLRIICEHIKEKPEVTITYFVCDDRKDGGRYDMITGKIKRIDEVNLYILLTNNIKILMSEIINISGKIFDELDSGCI